MPTARHTLTAVAALATAAALTLPASAQAQPAGGRQPMAQQGGQQDSPAPLEYRQVRGTIIGARRVPVRGTDKTATLVLLQTGSGQRAVADLGTERIGVRLRHGAELAVRGRPVVIGDQRVILQANAIHYGGQPYDVNRPALRHGSATDWGDRSATGQGQSKGQDRQREAAGMPTDWGNRRVAANKADAGGSPEPGALLNFRRHDTNDDGGLGREELAAAMMAAWDRDQDGALTRQEVKGGAAKAFGKGDVTLRPAQWDGNGDGRITGRELRATLRQTGMFGQLDRDNDGIVTVPELRVAGKPDRKALARRGSPGADAGQDQAMAQGTIGRAVLGTVASIDRGGPGQGGMLTLRNGSSFAMGPDMLPPGIRAGDPVRVRYQLRGGEQVAVAIAPAPESALGGGRAADAGTGLVDGTDSPSTADDMPKARGGRGG